MTIRFITDHQVLFIPEKKILVVADLHIGLEHELYKSGIVIPPQGDNFKKQIDELIEITHAKILIILGDLKHKVPGSTLREDKEIPKFLEKLKNKVKIILLKGNHDDRIEEIVSEGVKIYSSRGFKIDKYGFFHGHAWPSKELMSCNYLFMGHVHPVIEFKDTFGFRVIEQVWVRGRLDEKLVREKYKIRKMGKLQIVILPSFNKLLGGITLNTKVSEELIGPILTNNFLDLNKTKVYLLDGTNLGEMKHLKEK